jgi:hypothetical protein
VAALGIAPRRAGALIGALLLVAVLFPHAALAQDGGDNPYGSTTTTVDRGPDPSCRLRDRDLSPGETATAQVKAVARDTHVEIRFDGEVVAEAEATGPGSSPQVNIDIDFVVPADAGPGEHHVTAVAPSFTLTCGSSGGREGAVMGASLERENQGGSLPRTGVYIALLVVTALALLLGGRAILTASRRRAAAERRSQARRQRHSSRH